MLSNKTVPLWLMSLMLFAGCASLSDFHYEKSQKMRAWKEYKQCGNPGCSKYPADYKKGWKDGFYEVATGGSCCPPSVAPACYWDPKQILDDCDNRRHAYYSGWQDGAARASQYPDTHFLRIYETCECPFPRCECPKCGISCGSGSCGCNTGGCQTCTEDFGMVYDSGTIEADREIMMMPIPEIAPDVVPDAASPEVQELPPAAVEPPVPQPELPQPALEEEAPVEAATEEIPPVPAEPVLSTEPMTEAEPTVASPTIEEPLSSSDSVLPTPAPEEPPVPQPTPQPTPEADAPPVPQPEADATPDADVGMTAPFTYDFAADNSQTIEFGTSDSDDYAVREPATVLSDFDVQLDGVGLIE